MHACSRLIGQRQKLIASRPFYPSCNPRPEVSTYGCGWLIGQRRKFITFRPFHPPCNSCPAVCAYDYGWLIGQRRKSITSRHLHPSCNSRLAVLIGQRRKSITYRSYRFGNPLCNSQLYKPLPPPAGSIFLLWDFPVPHQQLFICLFHLSFFTASALHRRNQLAGASLRTPFPAKTSHSALLTGCYETAQLLSLSLEKLSRHLFHPQFRSLINSFFRSSALSLCEDRLQRKRVLFL